MQKTKFEWDESLAKAYAVYYHMALNSNWCECVECFERRYNIAKELLVYNGNDPDFHLKVIKLMKF